MKKRLLLAAPHGAPGPMTALRNHSAILKPYVECNLVTLEQLITPSLLQPLDPNQLIYRISKRTGKAFSIKKMLSYGNNIIFGTFGPIHENIIRKLNKHGVSPSFMWCSTFGQMELTPHELQYYVRLINLLKKGNIRYLFLHRRLIESIGCFVKGAVFLPHSIDLTPYNNIQPVDLPGLNVDLFCRPRFGKNILNQIAAFEMADTKGRLHTNFAVESLRATIEHLSSNIIIHKWLPIDKYFSLIAGMDLSLQVTIGESFNYAVCERMCLGVPVLTTKDIYLIAGDDLLAKHLCVQSPDTPIVIANMIKDIINNRKLRQALSNQCQLRIREVAKQNNNQVIDFIIQNFVR